ncbi:DMT family transporter [Paenibacillus glycinis]|uniref:EamA family transporter n=1 Tax=Paenibacillus glycinis TaxID=2697035 RepID=A0ABW9XKX7_9BACL|nr:DMT family transporter [Paenibacillus glycinis]NBD23278.1 EamA family transporter [Paenibacillus glycinis]
MNKFTYIGLVLGTTLIMGLAFPVGKIGLTYAPPFFLMGLRFTLAGALLAVIARMIGKPRPRGRNQWLQASAIGLFQSAGVMGCAYYSMRWITSGESSIITCTNPLIVILLSTVFGGAAYRGRQWLGVAVGIVGVAFSFGLHLGLQPGTFIGLAGAFSFAAATLLIKRWGAGFDMTALAAYQMLAGGMMLLVLSLMTEHPYFAFTGTSVLVTLWLALVCSIVQFMLWFYLLRRGDPAKTSSFLFLVPVFGVISSWLLLGERVQWYVGVGGAFICAGIFLVNWEGKGRPARTAAIQGAKEAGA